MPGAQYSAAILLRAELLLVLLDRRAGALLTLAYELKRRGGGLGVAAICSGSGQGNALLLEVKG